VKSGRVILINPNNTSLTDNEKMFRYYSTFND